MEEVTEIPATDVQAREELPKTVLGLVLTERKKFSPATTENVWLQP